MSPGSMPKDRCTTRAGPTASVRRATSSSGSLLWASTTRTRPMSDRFSTWIADPDLRLNACHASTLAAHAAHDEGTAVGLVVAGPLVLVQLAGEQRAT